MSKLMSSDEWCAVLRKCGVKIITATLWGDVFADVVTDKSFSKGEEEIDEFLGQVLHESAGLTQLKENLDYSAARLMQVWPTRFPTFVGAQLYAHNPDALANFVYAGRMGNCEPGDGARFMGRGPIGLTGRDNYEFVGNLIGQDLVDLPELMEQPRYALEATIAWWENRIPDSMLGDPTKITKRVNGGILGLNDRILITNEARAALGDG